MYFYEVSDKTAACTIVTQNYISLRTNNFALNIKQVKRKKYLNNLMSTYYV